MNTTPTSHTRRLGQRLASLAHVLPAVLALAALAVPNQTSAQVQLPSAPPYITVSTAYNFQGSVAIGDMNGDGNNDVVLAAAFSNNVQVVLGNGQGGFGTPQTTATGLAGAGPIALGDFNGDGHLDVVVLNRSALGNLAVFFGDGAGNLGTPSNYDIRTSPGSDGNDGINYVAVGDVNGDGKPDLIVTSNSPTGKVWVLLNNGSGGFSIPAGPVWTRALPRGDTPAGNVAAGDVDGDGKCDIVVTSSVGQFDNPSVASVTVLFGDGSGSFPVSVAMPFPVVTLGGQTGNANQANGLAIADMDHDGELDLIVAASNLGHTSNGCVTVFRHTASRTFDAGVTYLSPAGRSSDIAAGDLNSDGYPDVVVAGGANGGGFAYFLNDGTGNLGDGNYIAGTGGAGGVTMGDLTHSGNGTLDVVIGNSGQTLLLQNGPAAPAAQLFFTDALTGPSSPNLAAFPAGKYSYTGSGLQRSQSNSDTDRPVVTTALNTYLASATGNFAADITVTIANNDIAYFGLGQGDADVAGYNGEPGHAFYFRAHNNFTNGGGGYYGIQAMVRATGSNYQADHDIGTYSPGSAVTLRITRIGDNITMSIVGGGSVTYSLSAYQATLGLTGSNTKVFLGNTSVGTTFSNLKIYPLPNDVTPPVITAPVSMTAEATSPSGAAVIFNPTPTATDDVDGPVPVTANPPSGSTFPLGTTPVSLSASDAANNTATGSFNVTVKDTTPPVIGTAPVVPPVEATVPGGALVNFTVPTATDIVDGTDIVIATPASGTTFALGNTTVTLKSTDAHGNSSSKTFSVTVRDTTAPVIATVSSNLTVEATSSAGALVSYTAATATDVVGPVTIGYSQASGTTFPLGTTTVTVTATDGAGNAAIAKTFTVTVQDTTAPVITVPTVAAVEATSAAGAIVNYPVATATDAVGVTSLTYSKASGTTFAIGTTTVTVTAKDAAGNTSTKTFNVTVKDTTAPTVTATMTARGGGDDESAQFFTLAFSATDLVGVKTLTAVLNGVAVTNGQVVQLQTIKSGAQTAKRDDGKLQIKATSFALVVTASDAAGNTITKTVVPVFVKNGKDDEDKKGGDDKNGDDGKDDKGNGDGDDGKGGKDK